MAALHVDIVIAAPLKVLASFVEIKTGYLARVWFGRSAVIARPPSVPWFSPFAGCLRLAAPVGGSDQSTLRGLR